MSMISPTLSLAGKAPDCSCTPVISWIRAWSACGSMPISRIVPESGDRRPMAHSTVVVLPGSVRAEDAEDLALGHRE